MQESIPHASLETRLAASLETLQLQLPAGEFFQEQLLNRKFNEQQAG